MIDQNETKSIYGPHTNLLRRYFACIDIFAKLLIISTSLLTTGGLGFDSRTDNLILFKNRKFDTLCMKKTKKQKQSNLLTARLLVAQIRYYAGKVKDLQILVEFHFFPHQPFLMRLLFMTYQYPGMSTINLSVLK